MCESRECTRMHGGHGPLVPGYYRTGLSGVFPSIVNIAYFSISMHGLC